MSFHRHEIDFVGHQKIQISGLDLNDTPPINNIIFKATEPNEVWLEEATTKIGDWRAIFRSSYIGWSLSINGLFVASEKYSNPEWSLSHAFEVRSMRLEQDILKQVSIASWSGDHTAKVYTSVAPMLLAHGVLDMFGAMEEFIFDLYRIYLNHNPQPLLQGDDYRELRKLHRSLADDLTLTSEWEMRWAERLEAWQRKKIYDGLDKVFLSFCSETKLEEPKWYKYTTVETWAETIKGFSILRNCIAHGVRIVPKELADFSVKPCAMAFDFKEGQDLKMKLYHLQSIELFCDQLLTALNFSLLQIAGIAPPIT